MSSLSLSRSLRYLAPLLLVLCAVSVLADPATPGPDAAASPLVQAADATTDAAVAKPVEPELTREALHRKKNKAVAFWGVTFMLTTSVLFSAFGAYAIQKNRKAPKNAPESPEAT